MNKEQNFVSAVVHLGTMASEPLSFLKFLYESLDNHFFHFEIVVVKSSGVQRDFEPIREWAKGIAKPLTVVSLPLGQPHEQCMNAGLDIAIGDYVYEFDATVMVYPKELIWQAYETAIHGYDIVTVCPKCERKSSKLFYAIFNKHSGTTAKLRTEAFRLVSRRAINRVHAMSANLPYRKAAYAACGLNAAVLEFEGANLWKEKARSRIELAVDSLILYTDFAYRFSLGFSLLMLFGTVAMMVYTFVVYLLGNPVNGWTTTMLALTAGLTGVFAILTMILRYLSLILKLIFQKQSYLVEGIEKL